MAVEPEPSASARPSPLQEKSTSFEEPARPPSLSIADHELLRCIGRGSYGEVWLARNVMGTYRAVKIVYRKSFDHDRPFERELSGIRKFEPISRSHEGFVHVLHVGRDETEGCFYYIMEVGDDQTTGQQIDPAEYTPKTLGKVIRKEGKLPLQECLRLGLALTQALTEMHKHGLVHRDIKPSNIIFVNGVPKLADIGLVADINEARSYVGTEGFIPPEGPGSPQADVYSLGKVLYEASTGKDRQDFPELPTLWDKLPDHTGLLELNEVILQACRNDPAKRYPSAWEMYTDLLVLANGKSVRRLRSLERRFSHFKRILGVVALGLLFVGPLTFYFYREERHAFESRQRQVGASVAYGNRALENADLLGALPYFTEALYLDQGNPTREAAHRLRIGSLLDQCPKLTHFYKAERRLNNGEFSPNSNQVVITEFFGEARMWNLEQSDAAPQTFGPVGTLHTTALSPDGKLLAAVSQEGIVTIWETGSRKTFCRLIQPDRTYGARFSPDGSRIVTAGRDGVARVWKLSTGKVELSLQHHTAPVRFADFSHDGQRIVTTSQDQTARLWDAKSGQLLELPLEVDPNLRTTKQEN